MNFILQDAINKYIPFSREKDGKEKRLFDWNIRKNYLHKRKVVRCYVGEIWWCATGENIGYEINGKGYKFARPVLILKITSKGMAMVVPLTSTHKDLPGYFKYGNRSLLFEQARVLSTKRLYDRQKVLKKKQIQEIQKSFIKYLS